MRASDFIGHHEHLMLGRAAAGERNDCSVYAFAQVTGASYRVSHRELAKQGRKNGGRAWSNQTRDALRANGYECQLGERAFNGIRTALGATRRATKLGGTWMIFVTGHVYAVVDGSCTDWAKDRRKRFRFAWRITEPGGPEAKAKRDALRLKSAPDMRPPEPQPEHREVVWHSEPTNPRTWHWL